MAQSIFKSKSFFKKRWVWVILSLVILIGLLIWGFSWLNNQNNSQNQNFNYLDLKTKVVLQKVNLQKVPDVIHSVGVLMTPKTAIIRSQISGQVTQVLFKAGQYVKKNQLLITLNHQSQTAELAEQKAQLIKAQLAYKRYKNLQKLDPEGVSNSQLDILKANVTEAKAAVNLAQKNLSDTDIRAPFSGFVSGIDSSQYIYTEQFYGINTITAPIGVGSLVTQHQALIEIASQKAGFYVQYSVPESQANLVKKGQAVIINLLGAPHNPEMVPEDRGDIIAEVASISPVLNTLSRTVTVKANILYALKNGKKTSPYLVYLFPGSFAKVAQIINPKYKTLAIPALSIVPTMSGVGVYQIKNNKAVFTPITMGARFGDWVQVLKGLKQGEHIVVKGQDNLHEGMSVDIIKAKKIKHLPKNKKLKNTHKH